ncbi:MAG: Rrf2 family transcriptional regulator [Myxococcales bacterium]|nr:Rrf2 family transcriptional regulator [Myxococcales bacterium]
MTPNDGLQDLYFGVGADLPHGIKTAFVFHQFWSDEGGTDLGSEYDMVASKAINANWSVLVKAAFFDGTMGSPMCRVYGCKRRSSFDSSPPREGQITPARGRHSMISQTTEYALRAVVHLAARSEEGPARAKDIAEAIQVPVGYLQKILRMLCRHGLLTASRVRRAVSNSRSLLNRSAFSMS